MHPKSLNLVVPYESNISTYMRYFRAVPSRFVCANSNFQNEFPFCVPVPLMKRQGVANIFRAKCVILKMSVYSLVIAQEYGVIWMPSPEMKNKFTLCCQIINSLESVGMEGTRGYGLPWIVKEWWKRQ